MKVKTIKSCDMPVTDAVWLFGRYNRGKVKVNTRGFEMFIVTDTEPKDLVYPEGWYYAKGTFRNKHESTTGIYSEIDMLMSDGTPWRDKAPYQTRF